MTLQPVKDYSYNMQYHYQIQGLIYNLIRDSDYAETHNKEGYKFFCFSNIFPFEPVLKKGKNYFLLISSPDESFISILKEKAGKRVWNKETISISYMELKILSLKILAWEIPDKPFKLITSTPIIVIIPKEKLKSVDIDRDLYFKSHM